ncbi:MAG: hypothetical protein A3J09_02635 [Candidatus Zambryskibacteria bacterium RIFCSPLOWO2_02_FULL_51_21]|uniref:Putative pre-16S rRNA nuclease n=1 Tax=Candidatus Zambryskibacteria bacterium RIFCSPHIGHO2_02_FULL_43_37 TaxID=1802749 RepID=A0A1G2TI26_9BACT|nr:MAG: hypothetical protein A2723_02625 [Candidatus Zambryskibacteria bacterium RIFCSPHIGHO2_01_FULL_52_18]OHA96319.1 MAG: hypothetical protein A3D49_00265 [Candidatus Zambryskibacteria bacterium RIFCSPHIGHO2_02_FULL_43_37]OHB07722.1 MAG: hypothetical protein A2944_00140 [Candidatus Zambryskibacteria bacterium RIFCSPLOWO2_01_FULL_52_12]OHB11422.1 MAG: hypothetical protein A3J09_02635 [Candidatus Zambryskibacteria bacterium RIFCSPLOWO2_02_FULL_51_21]
MKVMAIDYGEKRVGIASTDESGGFALPRKTFPNDEKLLENIIRFKTEEGIDRVVIGESKNYKSEANPVMEKIEKFRSDLSKLGIETILHPEILTTMEARQIQGQTDMTDASAAALILKSYIDSINNS